MSLDRTFREDRADSPVRSLSIAVVEGPDKGAKWTAPDVIKIGTDRTNDLVLVDETVSRHHLDVKRLGDRISITDHESTNGTEVSGVRIKEASVSPGCVLKLGRTSLRVDDGDAVAMELHEEDHFAGLIGATRVMRQLMARMNRAARSDASILLLGETGVGKDLVARAIHDVSPRAGNPFEIVDCGSALPTLLASQLFGHERGAFTGADRQHVGAFERASGGTLFLDEIGELPPSLQIALLGALERRSFLRLGGKEPVSVDVRVLCATNRDLRADVNAGAFREDLYYRIAVILLPIPPLRERLDDLPLLADHFLRNAGYRGKLEDVFSSEGMESLRHHRWPGNVRELRNTVEAALVMGETPLFEEEATDDPSDEAKSTEMVPVGRFAALTYSEARERMVRRCEEIYFKLLLQRAEGNVSAAARLAQMNRSYLTRMLKRHGIRGQGGSGNDV